MDHDLLLLFCSDYSVARFGERRREFPPLGVLYLAAACERQGIRTAVRDLAELSDEEIPSATVAGLSVNTSYIYPAFKKRVRAIRDRCRFLAAGGQHATIFPRETFRDLGLDYLLVGEGEFSLPDLAGRLRGPGGQAADIPGVYSGENIEAASYSEKLRIRDLDQLPFPARHLLNRRDILLKNRIPRHDVFSTNIITSRGCPYGCRFCGNVYKGFASRSADNVRREIEQLLAGYPEIGGLVFMDENLFFSRPHAARIIECMSDFKLKWTCNARVDGFTRELVPALRDSGCVEIKYGIESGCQRILDAMDKKITLGQMEDTLRATRESGIETKCFLMFGYPGDDEDSAEMTIRFLDRNRPYIGRVNLFSFAPLPNSPVYREGICRDFSWEDYRIYRQLTHWWGDERQFLGVKNGYKMLKQYIEETYGDV